jgi:hypothetical protein
MADPSNVGNPMGANPGPPDYSVSQSARLTKGDPTKDTRLLQQRLSELKSNELSKLQDILHKYQEFLSKEAKDDPTKAAAFKQRLRSFQNDPGLQDLLDNMLKGGAGAEALAMYLETTIAEADAANAAGMLGAVQKERNKRTRRNLAMLGAAGLILLLGLLFGIDWLSPAGGKPTEGQLGAAVPNLGIVVGPTGTPTCPVFFHNPRGTGEIPDYGPLKVEWSGMPGAASYALKVIPPPAVSVPWLFPTRGTTRTIYMENFPAAGEYQFSVDALDANGVVLCGAALRFRKSAYVPPSGKKGDTGGGGSPACTSMGLLVTCP